MHVAHRRAGKRTLLWDPMRDILRGLAARNHRVSALIYIIGHFVRVQLLFELTFCEMLQELGFYVRLKSDEVSIMCLTIAT